MKAGAEPQKQMLSAAHETSLGSSWLLMVPGLSKSILGKAYRLAFDHTLSESADANPEIPGTCVALQSATQSCGVVSS